MGLHLNDVVLPHLGAFVIPVYRPIVPGLIRIRREYKLQRTTVQGFHLLQPQQHLPAKEAPVQVERHLLIAQV